MSTGENHKDTHEESAHDKRAGRRRIVQFVLVFAGVALAMLISYRYLIHTRVNDWYLFQAAVHTAWVLDTINEAEVEPYHFSRQNAQEMRATMDAWLAGRDTPTEAEIEAAEPYPLTRWERWSYRSLEGRRSERTRANGPRVHFVLRHDPSTRIAVLSGRINEIESSGHLSQEERRESLAPLQEQIRHYRDHQRAQRRLPDDDPEKQPGLVFSFILVPECGAIEIMAIFIAAVIAFPASWKKRIIGIVAGTPIMYAVNIFRLSVLAIIGALDQSPGRAWFNFTHEYLWQAVYIVFVVAVWLIWVEYVVKRKRS